MSIHRVYAFTSFILGFAALFTSVQVQGQLADGADGAAEGPYREYAYPEVGVGDTVKCLLSYPGYEQLDDTDDYEYSILDEQILMSTEDVESPHIWVYEFNGDQPNLVAESTFDEEKLGLTGSANAEVTPYPLTNPEGIVVLDEINGNGTSKIVLFQNTFSSDLIMDCYVVDEREVLRYMDDSGGVVKKTVVKRKIGGKKKVAAKKARKKAAATKRKAKRKSAR